MKELTTQTNSAEMLQTLRHTVAPGLTDVEFSLFAEMCRATGLNPVTKEIWAIKAGGRLQLMTGINGFLRIANSHPQFDGMEVTNEFDGKTLVACTVKVHRKDRKYPSVATAYLAEYAKPSPIWKQMPSIMLAKCAKSLAIREAFIQELGGLYTAEEMPNEYSQHRAASNSVESVTVEPAVEPASPTSAESLTPSVANDPLPWATPVAAKKKLNKAVTTRYDVSGLPGQQLEKAQAYLTENLCKQVGDMLWECPIRLEKLTGCIVE